MSAKAKAVLSIRIQDQIEAIKEASKNLAEHHIILYSLQAKFEAIQAAEDLAKQSAGKTKTIYGVNHLGRAGSPITTKKA